MSDPVPPQSDNESAPLAGGDEQLDAIRELGVAYPPARAPGNVHVLSIVGQIEGHLLLPTKNKTTKYEHVIPQLVAVEQDPTIDGLLVILNTVGGDIEAGLAIAEMVNSLSKPVVSLVLGGGHSIGAPIAVAADHSFIAPTATITIHPIRLTGLVIGVPQTYEYLDKMQARVIQFLVKHSHVTEEKLREAMFRTGELVRDVGTVLIGNDAVQLGLIAELGGLSQALTRLHLLIEERRGERLADAAARDAARMADVVGERTADVGSEQIADVGGERLGGKQAGSSMPAGPPATGGHTSYSSSSRAVRAHGNGMMDTRTWRAPPDPNFGR